MYILYSIFDSFPTPWFANIVNYLVASVFPPLASKAQNDKIKSDAKHYIWDDPYLWKLCSDQVIRRCIPDHEIDSVLQFCHSSTPGGHLGIQRTARKVEDSPIRDYFLDDHLYILYSIFDSFPTPWFANIVNYLVASVFPPLASKAQNDKIKSDAKHYIWDDPYLWKLCSDQVIRRCIPDHEIDSVLQFCHSSTPGGHLGIQRTARKVLDCGFYWPTIFKDAWRICSTCEPCQRACGSPSWRQQMPQQPMLFCEVFDVWGPSSRMRGESVALVSLVREHVAHLHGDNKCLNNPCYSVRCLMCGV